jgi:hypothetical protein
MATNNNNMNNIVPSNLDETNYNTDIAMKNDVNLAGISNDYNNVNTALGAVPSVTQQIIQQANGTVNPEKLLMFEGCALNGNTNKDNEHCFMGNESALDYQYQTRNEWCNAVGGNLLFNRMNNANTHTFETKPLNDRPLAETPAGEQLNEPVQPLCEQYGCSRGKQCNATCKQLNCMNCHC